MSYLTSRGPTRSLLSPNNRPLSSVTPRWLTAWSFKGPGASYFGDCPCQGFLLSTFGVSTWTPLSGGNFYSFFEVYTFRIYSVWYTIFYLCKRGRWKPFYQRMT